MPAVAESGTLTKPALGARAVLGYHQAEELTGVLIYFMLVFSPWAFGTTEPWSIWVMRACGYALGLMFLAKVAIRRWKDYRPARWERGGKEESGKSANRFMAGGRERSRSRNSDWFPSRSRLVCLLGGLTICLLLYCLAAAVNAQGSCDPVLGTFEYYHYWGWLPHSFDRRSTVEAWWSYLALAGAFWAIVDWLPGKEWREGRLRAAAAVGPASPARLRRLLWVVSLSGGLLALEAIVQKVSKSPRLLFVVQPQILQDADTHLGSYAYRSNGAQYFNLLWPVCAGLWWRDRRSGCVGPRTGYALLAAAGMMAACPLLCGARGPALVDLMMLALAVPVLAGSILREKVWPRVAKWKLLGGLSCVFAGVLILGLGLGWRDLRPRLERFRIELRQREALYDSARRMALDYPLFGTGPGTFERLFQVYRGSVEAYWPAQLHNDWLETRITFGWVGSGLLGLALLVVCAGGFAPGGLRLDRTMALFLWLALAGCLLQARWDFPLQVYSILSLFLTWCAVLFCVSYR